MVMLTRRPWWRRNGRSSWPSYKRSEPHVNIAVLYNGYWLSCARASMPSAQTIAVAMSGGVDSSTVAAMLRAEGHTVVGLTMQLWNQRRLAGREGMPEQVQGRCCSIDDVYDARRVAQQIGIPYYVVNHEDRFE